ncbi:MAG TPA: hypothetical protein VM141_13290 [Planctomycetota bacterium]|nr:hypothetical protein [Planctomycetota bacterium]
MSSLYQNPISKTCHTSIYYGNGRRDGSSLRTKSLKIALDAFNHLPGLQHEMELAVNNEEGKTGGKRENSSGCGSFRPEVVKGGAL